ncbi:MAG: hypothetical protein GDA47_03535, partial [Rhodospirillales bacterium]|nr:hypothetical protein [Rhodospirillales bacterium]
MSREVTRRRALGLPLGLLASLPVLPLRPIGAEEVLPPDLAGQDMTP